VLQSNRFDVGLYNAGLVLGTSKDATSNVRPVEH